MYVKSSHNSPVPRLFRPGAADSIDCGPAAFHCRPTPSLAPVAPRRKTSVDPGEAHPGGKPILCSDNHHASVPPFELSPVGAATLLAASHRRLARADPVPASSSVRTPFLCLPALLALLDPLRLVSHVLSSCPQITRTIVVCKNLPDTVVAMGMKKLAQQRWFVIEPPPSIISRAVRCEFADGCALPGRAVQCSSHIDAQGIQQKAKDTLGG